MSVSALPDASVNTGEIPKLRAPRVSQRTRNIELALIVLALIIGFAAIALVQLGAIGHLEVHPMGLCLLLAGLVFGLHIILRFVAPQADPLVMPIALVLNWLGIAEIYRIDIHNQNLGWDALATKQIAWTGLALGAAAAVMLLVRNHRSLQRFTYTAGLLAVVFLVLPALPFIGQEISGARVWIHLGPLSFQPGEVAKIGLAVFFAGYLVSHRESLSMVGRKFLWFRLPRGRDLGPLIAVWILSMLVIVIQKDLGTGLLFFGLFLSMLYVATARVGWVVLGVSMIVIGAVAANQFLGYVHARFENWYDAFNPSIYNAEGGSYQVVQGIFGLAHGGLIGTGLGEGMPYITPVSQSDYIISSLGEELGLAGMFAILSLYALFVARGLRIGFAGHDDFGTLLSVGLSFVIALQCFIVIGGITRLLPLTGLTTPFLAAGGSSLVANWMIVALLLRISDATKRDARLVVSA